MDSQICCTYPKPFSGKIIYDRSNMIEKGAFGMVFLGSYDNKKVCIKRISTERVQKKSFVDLKINLDHENIVKLHTVEYNDDFWFIITECCLATLSNVIDGNYTGTPLSQDLNVLQQCMNGLYYIHQNGLIHGNINPKNILISESGKVKVSIDFGICKIVHPKDTIIMDAYENTTIWMAPEIIIPYNDPSFDDSSDVLPFTTLSDIFSSGCVFFVFMTRHIGGLHPYGDRQKHLETAKNIKEKKLKDINKDLLIKDCVFSTLENMVSPDPQKRPSVVEVIQQFETLSCM